MSTIDAEHFRALFEPRGVVVVGVSSHPGKFGFVALHNLLVNGYRGRVYATNREGIEVLGTPTVTSIDDLPEGIIDLAFLCTPAFTNLDTLRKCAAKGIRAAYVASAGYGETGPEGLAAQDELAAMSRETGLLVVGPNGQGMVSTPASMCLQIVSPFPPAGRIGIASQSGNFSSVLMNLATHYGVGVSRTVSVGNAAVVSVVDLLETYADDDQTDVGIGYFEGIPNGREFYERLRKVNERMPVVVVKGGTSGEGARAAASHTGSLATNDRVFEGVCRQAGLTRVQTIEDAYDVAAAFATQPLPRGPRVCVVSNAGGWGVVTADAISRTSAARTNGLQLLPMPDDLRAQLDELLPPRWSRNNPIDMAGGEKRDTTTRLLEMVAQHDEVDSVIFLGMGIQSAEARMMTNGPFYPEHGLDRIVDFHRRSDRSYVTAAHEISVATGKPILTATELAIVDPSNPAVSACRELGRHCFVSAFRAVNALDHLWRYARFLRSIDADAPDLSNSVVPV